MFDVVLQGPVYPYTPDVINLYLEQSWVSNVIVSTWMGAARLPKDDHVFVVMSEDVENPGVGNRNRQIKSSREGLKYIETEYVIKGRTDQLMKDLPMMKRFFDKFHDGHALFVLGLYTYYPFHPRDHFFMGKSEDVINLFDVPYDPYNGVDDYRRCLRAEAWIGSFYYARFDSRVQVMIDNTKEYLVDGAPMHQEAMELDMEMRSELFRVFPRINMSWPKQNLPAYHYSMGQQFSEYWYEERWED